MKQLTTSIADFWRATFFLSKHGLLYYFIPLVVSLVLNISLFAGIFTLGKEILEGVFPSMKSTFMQWDSNASILKNLSSISLKGYSTLFGIILLLLTGHKLSKYIVLIILSPLFAILSEKVESIISGRKFPFSFNQLIKDIIRGCIIAIRNLIIELCLIILFTLVGLFAGPLAVFVVPILWIISAYFYGFSMMDYTSERHKLSISQSIQFVRNNRYIAIGNGSMYSLLDMIPVVGLCIAPINAVVGATLSILENKKPTQVNVGS